MDSRDLQDPTATPQGQDEGRAAPVDHRKEARAAGEVIPSNTTDRMAPISSNSFTQSTPNSDEPMLVQTPEPDQRPASPVELWVHRSWIVMYVVFCIWIGIVVAALPWTRVWTDNSIVIAYPGLRAFLQQNFVRGAVTGVGLLDLFLGVWEAVHYRESKA